MTLPSRYGYSPGPYQFVQPSPLHVSMEETGTDLSLSPATLPDHMSPNIVDVKVIDGGVRTDHQFVLLGTRYAGAGDKTVIGVAEFQRKALNVVLIRMRPTGWDRWNGSAWVTLTGALSGLAGDRVYSCAMQDLFLVANKVDKVKKWDGVDATAITDLSTDAPICHYIVPFANRLVAARVGAAGANDPYLVKWSADGIITDWTNASLGAGTTVLEPEGRFGAPEFITGLSALETAMAIYRQRSIVLGVRTGVGAAPFRFHTVVFGLGTESPHAIVNAGVTIGDFFIGTDLNIYNFNGKEPPIPVGEPIHRYLRTQITDPVNCIATVDRRNLLLWVLIPTGSSTNGNIAWVFDINQYIGHKKLRWWRRDLPAGYPVINYGQTAPSQDPIVDSVLNVVDTVNQRVDDYANTAAKSYVLLGDTDGGVFWLDPSTQIATGIWESKQFGTFEKETTVDWVRVQYSGNGSIELAISTDGGTTWQSPKTLQCPASPRGNHVAATFGITAHMWQIRLRILSGDLFISHIHASVLERGYQAA